MTDKGLPCIDLLEATPEILRGLMTELTEEDARWKPAPDRFSIAEVLAHLSHSEGQCYRMRLDRFLAETRPEFVEYLRGLSAGAGGRVALHKEYGEITLAQMLNEWALHDLGHIRQIAELARARRYAGGAGPMAVSYNLKP